ncbi:MAG: hypothetical protein E4H20_10065 [Spirochaetales bacterium]|nr:MAG: hypothetical protein E4H20_10065 [Spirochaetales bacterium]
MGIGKALYFFMHGAIAVNGRRSLFAVLITLTCVLRPTDAADYLAQWMLALADKSPKVQAGTGVFDRKKCQWYSMPWRSTLSPSR